VLTLRTIAISTVLGVFLVARCVAVLGMSQGITFAEHQARVLVGVRPF
jgi:hypothetical protein